MLFERQVIRLDFGLGKSEASIYLDTVLVVIHDPRNRPVDPDPGTWQKTVTQDSAGLLHTGWTKRYNRETLINYFCIMSPLHALIPHGEI